MNQKKSLKNEIGKGIKRGLLFGLILSLILFLLILSPFITDFFFGEKIIDNHLKNLIGNENKSEEIAKKLLAWEYNNTYAPYSDKLLIKWLPIPIYRIHNKTTVFLRSTQASWLILTQLGNCGEHSYYFVELMNKKGFRSRLILAKGEDHVFAEFYNESGNRIIVEPSGNQMYLSPLEKGNNTKWSRIVAMDLAGNEEDITEQFLTNLSTLNLTIDKGVLSKRTSILISSTYLMSVGGKQYKDPIPVIDHSFNNNTDLSLKMGSKKEYELKTIINLAVLNFEKKIDLDLSKDKNINIDPLDVIRIQNIRPNLITYFILSVIVLTFAFKFRSKLELTRSN